jgi:hypothetical protein
MSIQVTISSIPWASWDTESTDGLVHICPACDKRIKEPNTKGRNYDRHYAKHHGATSL